MNKEAQRIAIATALGWEWYHSARRNQLYLDGPPSQLAWSEGYNPKVRVTWEQVPDYLNDLNAMHVTWEQVPDYLNDLNAMHKAEVFLFKTDTYQEDHYGYELYKVMFGDNLTNQSMAILCRCSNFIHATAAQRAEAFLKTLKLWGDAE